MSISFDLVCFSASDLKACEQTLNACGGLSSLQSSLNTDFADGLDNDDKEDLESRRKMYGKNEFPEPEISSWFEMFFDTFEDPTLIILLVAAFISLGIGGWEAYTSTATSLFERMQGMIEGTAILVASLLVSAITATQDHDKAMKFQELNAASESINVTVTRGGEVMSVHTSELCVGDLVTLNSGDSVPADGIFIDGSHVNCDESGLTGEPDDIAKTSDPLARFMFSGSRLTSGFCRMVVVAVGENSEWGRIKKGLDVKSEATPLQDKLETLANQIGYVGMAFAAATFVAMMADWYYHSGAVGSPTMFDTALKAFILAVTIVVVAVPEGLPLAVTLSLAYSTSKMMEDNNLIRVLAACETMGNATTICSDKTGTLTQNKMTVVEGWIAGEHAGDAESTSGDDLSWSGSIMNNEDLRYFLSHGISCNSTAALCTDANGEVNVLGNKTEGALLQMLRKSFDIEYDPIRKSNFDTTKGDKLYTFTSERKCMSVLLMSAVGGDNSPRGSSKKKKSAAANGALNSVSYTKGASEIVLDKCTHYMDKKGQAVPISASVRKTLTSLINEMAKKALRTVAVSHCTYQSLPDLENVDHIESDMVLDGIFGIKDPLRPDVKEAVSICQDSGVMVRMVTGDNIDTAKAIAKECGILTEGGVALEGSEFRTMTPAALDEILPRLQVLARSSPTDKHLLVTRLNGLALPKNREEWENAHPGENWTKKKDILLPGYKEEWSAIRPRGGDVVGVTGDGTNDGPALRAADVGLSMGLSGTDVAKAASSIVILDDNFSSIVKAIKWGRSVFDNIRRFLQFQLTVNIVALTVTLLSAMGGRDPPLNAVMMLWVNLIMDALGALALGTEPPSGKLLERLPYKRDSSLVSRVMIRNILFQSCFQVLVLMYLLFLAPGDFGIPADSAVHVTLVFNTFVFCQIFNEMNARSIGSSMDIFKGVFGNPFFCIIIVFTCGMQYAMVEAEYVRWLVHAVPLDAGLWYKSVLIGSLSLPIGGLMRLIPVSENQDDFAEMPALLKTAVSKREKSGGSSSKKGQDESENGLVDSMTFALWLVVCFFVCALAFTEFGAMWMAHIETYLPAPVAAVVVPVLKVLGGALDKVLDATNTTRVF